MNAKKLSINKACVFLGLLLLLAVSATTIILYDLTNSISAVLCCLFFCLFVLSCVICFVVLIRRKLTLFSDLFCQTLDDMLSGKFRYTNRKNFYQLPPVSLISWIFSCRL